MTDPNRCPNCGCDLPADAPAGLCPECLLRQGFAENDSLAIEVGEENSRVARSGLPATTPPARFDPPPVEELASLFPGLEIVKPLGHGGMGAVYQARQTKLDRLVALKIIRPESASDAAFAERFLREARTLARLSHPSIVGVHDFGEVETAAKDEANSPTTLYYFVMEYVDGANLRQLIEAGELAPETAIAIVPQICEALQFAHDQGIVHRDIKPENILVDSRGQVKIADFGLARLTESSSRDFTLTGTHQVMGTPRYMAPEQMEGSHDVDHRADIYSLGVVFYEMLTGQVPAGHFDPPSKKVQIDVRLDEVVLRSLAREPERRYQQVSEVKTDVELISRSAASVPVPSQSAGTFGPAAQPAQSDPSLAATSATLPEAGSEPLPAYLANPNAEISRKAITGAAMILGGGLLFPFFILAADSANDSDVAMFLTGLMSLLALITAVGVSTLGVVAIEEIRRSVGRVRGLRLAFMDVVLCPTIAINVLLVILFHIFSIRIGNDLIRILSGPGSSLVEAIGSAVLSLLPIVGMIAQGVITFHILRSSWRKFSGPWLSREEAARRPRPEFCWRAVGGFALAVVSLGLLLLLLLLLLVTASGEYFSTDQGLLTIAIASALCGLASCVIGLKAVRQIRESNGRLWGMGLAFFAAAVFPIVLLNAAIFGAILVALQGRSGSGLLSDQLGRAFLFSFPAWLILDWSLLARKWKRLSSE